MTAHERTGWRDEYPSTWHRTLGSDYPMCDVDGLLYHYRKPVAIIDWKRMPGATWRPDDANIDAQRNLANGYRVSTHPDGLPFYVVAYWPHADHWRPHAMNAPALAALTGSGRIDGSRDGCAYRTMDSTGWAHFEGHLRGLTAPAVLRAVAGLQVSNMATSRTTSTRRHTA